MADLASLYIKVDSKGVVTASKDLNKLTDDSKKTETATEGVTRGFSKLQAVVIALASSYALLKMAQYIKDAALLAARYETLGVVMRVVGNNAGYSGAQMEVFARGLQKSGIAMVESRNTLARMIQAQIDLTSSQKLARIAQDAAVIGNINSSEAFERMIYGLQTGMPRILRTIGLNVDFQKSLKKSADTLGIKTKALSETQVMQARVNAVIKSGVLITGTYEAAMGTAGKKLTSFVRYVDDFKVKMGEAFGPATVMLVDAATQAMKDMQEQISKPEAQEALRELSSQLATTIVQLGQDLPKAIKSTTNAIADIQAIYNSLPPGVVGAAGAGLIGRILFGGWGPAKIVAGLYLINEGMSSIGAGLGDIVKSYKESVLYFGKAWDEIIGKTVKGLEFFTIDWDENKFISQFEKMQEILAKGIPIKLDFALEDPDKYFGEIIAEKLAWEKEGFESIEKWYKSIETLTQEARDFDEEMEDEETRMFEENLAYRLVVQKQYYKDIEAIAQKARDFDEEMEDEALRMARETAEYQKELADEAADYINKLAEAASYYKDLIGFEDTYHEKMLELIEAEAEARAKATGDDVAAAKWAAQEKGRLEQDLFENKTKYIDEGFSALASSFSDIASLYDEGSDAAKRWEEASKAMEIAQKAVAVVNAVAAIANQGLGDPYTAFARIAAMVATMGALLASIGESVGGGGGTSVSSLPTSTVLGVEAGTGSQSIANAWELLEDTYNMEYRELSGIHDEMKDLNDNISGLVASIFRTGGIDSSYISTGTTLGSMQSFADDIIEISYLGFSDIVNTLTFGISSWIDSAVSSLVGSIFGGGTETSITGSGISTSAAFLGSLIKGGGIGSQQYTDVHVHEEGGWFSSDSDYYYTSYKALDESVSRLFDLVFQDMSATLIELTLGLGADMNKTLNYVFEDAKINLQGMDSDEISDTLTEYFSALGDTAVDALFGDLIGMYQEVGEGLMETAARIIIDKAIVLEALEMTGQTFTAFTTSITRILTAAEQSALYLKQNPDVAAAGMDALQHYQQYGQAEGRIWATVGPVVETAMQKTIAFSETIISMAGDLETFYEYAEIYYDEFFTDAEKQIRLQGQLTEALSDLNIVLPDTRDGYRALIEGLDLTTESGMETYVILLKLAEASGTYYDTLEDNIEAIEAVQKELRTIIDAYELTDYQRQIQAEEEWRDAQLATWSELEDYMDSAEYVQGIADILKAFNYLLQDIEDQILDSQQNLIDIWADAARTLEDQIFAIKLSTGSPEDAQQRMALLKEQIATMTGGNIATYIAGFETSEEKISAINTVRDMWGEYLEMAQDVYQRPSDEYQQIYDEVLMQLEMMQGIATGYQSQEQILYDQLSVLTDIRDLIARFEGLDSYQSGTNYVPKTGLYELHVGEQVIPVNQRNYDGPQVSFTVNITGTGEPKKTAKEVRKEMENLMISGIGRKLIQTIARGH